MAVSAPNIDSSAIFTRGSFVDHGVRWLQHSLNLLGFCAGDEDGVWGRDTAGAFAAYTAARHLSSDIIRNPAMRNRIGLHRTTSDALQSTVLPTTSSCMHANVPVPPDTGATSLAVQAAANAAIGTVAPWAYLAIGTGTVLVGGAVIWLYARSHKRLRRR